MGYYDFFGKVGRGAKKQVIISLILEKRVSIRLYHHTNSCCNSPFLKVWVKLFSDVASD